jgi:hypothetical protein
LVNLFSFVAIGRVPRASDHNTILMTKLQVCIYCLVMITIFSTFERVVCGAMTQGMINFAFCQAAHIRVLAFFIMQFGVKRCPPLGVDRHRFSVACFVIGCKRHMTTMTGFGFENDKYDK